MPLFLQIFGNYRRLLILQRLFEKKRHCTNKMYCHPVRHTRESGYPVGVLKPVDMLDSRFHGNDRKNPL